LPSFFENESNPHDKTTTYLGRWSNGERADDPVWVFLPDPLKEKGSHAGPGATTQRMGQLESLQTVNSLGFLSDNIEYLGEEGL